MPSEARRGAIRILSNYARLFSTLVMGLILVPVQLAWLGNDGFGLLALVGASVGLAATLRDVMRHSLVRELGAAWHANDPEHFRRVYASAFVMCAFVSAATALVFVAVFVVIPVLRVPDVFVAPARWLIAAEGVSICLLVALAPAFNMYVVTERFAAHSFWIAAQRGAYLLSALVLYLVLGVTDAALGLTLFGVTSAGLCVLLLLAAVAIIVAGDRSLVPTLKLANRRTIREIRGTFGWNTGVMLAMNLHERVGAIIMNLVFGLWGNTIFGLALQLVSYVRMMTLGMTFGLDAVSARLSTADDHRRLTSLARHATRLHGYVAIPAALTVLVMAEPLLRLWVGRFVDDPDPDTGRTVIASAVVLVRIMVIGLASRAIADGWMKMLYGAGHIRRYAPLVLAGGLANPFIAAILIWLMPETINYTAVAWTFTGIFLLVHLLMVPAAGAASLKTRWQDLLGALVRPLVIAALPAFLLVLPRLFAGDRALGWAEVLVSCAAYGIAYGALGVMFGLSPGERTRLMNLARRTLGMGGAA